MRRTAASRGTGSESPAESGSTASSRDSTEPCGGLTYSTTSSPKPEIACIRFGALSTRILRTPRSVRICAPSPKVRRSVPESCCGQRLAFVLPAVAVDLRNDLVRRLRGTQHDDNPAPFLGDPAQGIANGPPRIPAPAGGEVMERVVDVDPDEGGCVGVDLAGDQREVDLAVGPGAESDKSELPELGGQAALGDPLDRLLVEHAVLDEIGDGPELESMALGDPFEVGSPRHRSVLVEDLDEHRGRLESRQPRQIAAGLRMAGAGEHAAGLRHQWKDVARLDEVGRPCARADRGPDRRGAVRGGNPRRDAGGGVDGDGELGALRFTIVADHQLQAERVAPLAGHRQADQAAAVTRHEVDRLRRHVRGRHHEIAFVLAVLVVDEHHHVAVSELGDQVVDGVE